MNKKIRGGINTMSKRNLKRAATVVLATTLIAGSAMSVYAVDGEGEGNGSYEGGALKYPTLQVKLPTIPAGTYDYIADPNGLIQATNTEKYENATFTGTTGIFFKTASADSGDTYTEKSAAQTLENQNAQDIDVSVKLEQKTPGDSSIEYAATAAFETSDKANKLYLAITDDAATNAKTAALSSTGAAILTTTVAGVPGNYKANYDTTNGYGYVKKDEADLTDWNDCSFIMTGALNKNATWGDSLTFPAIKVTWSYTEHIDAVDAVGNVGNDGKIYMGASSSAGFSARPSSVKVNGTAVTDYDMDEWGWVSMNAPSSGSVILLTVSDTVYKVVVS